MTEERDIYFLFRDSEHGDIFAIAETIRIVDGEKRNTLAVFRATLKAREVMETIIKVQYPDDMKYKECFNDWLEYLDRTCCEDVLDIWGVDVW